MNDHARELRRYASVLGRPTIMLDAADEIERLAAKLEAAEKERDALRTELNEIRYGVAVAHDTIKTLRAKVERMEKQEPVAWLDDGTSRAGSHSTSFRVVTEATKQDMPTAVAASFSTPLYALPGAQNVPDGWKLVPLEPTAKIRKAMHRVNRMNDTNKPGFKDDSGKVLMGTLLEFPLALAAVAEVATFGANKYTRGGWESVPNARVRYTDAMMRHLLDGDGVDDGPRGSGLLHEAHFVWNAIARLEIRLREVVDGVSTMSTPAEPSEANEGPKDGTGTILVWPDNSWMWEDDFTERNALRMGDDYERIRLPLSMGDDEVEAFLSRRAL